ncbi:RICIN domain-containing protein [Dactylosporangium darangshiense]|uniref:Ricin B lectin domain-containing protein n=1 Tax=Dactylosporangium darangshiense TaxID=579108 RepID=A0ABP8DCW4_9ACTN
MTVYGGPRPTPPAPKPDKVLLAALGFTVLAVIVGVILGVQAFTSNSPKGTSAAEREASVADPASEAPPSAAPSSAPAPPSPSPSPTQAKPALLAAKPTLMRPDHSGLCMQANAGNGGNASQQACDGNNATMLWVPRAMNNTQDTFEFINAADNRCMDVNGASKDNGAQIVIWDCHGQANQLWKLVRDGDGYRFVSLNSGRCIGIDAGNPAPGAVARQWDCDGSTNQRWQFQQLG